VVVQTGGTVTWTWNDSPVQHNVNFPATDPSPHPAGSATQATGTWSVAFTTVGTYHFFCNIHSGMTGTLIVVH
jgi:plastocyanin